MDIKEPKSISNYFSREWLFKNLLKRIGEGLNDTHTVEKYFNIRFKIGYIVVTIEGSKDINFMTIDQHIGSLQIHEERLKGNTKKN